MIIGVDAGCLGIKDKRLAVGVYHVTKNLLIALGKLDKKNTYILYSFSPIDKKLLEEFSRAMKNTVITPMKGWQKIWLPIQLLKDKPDIFLACNQASPFRFPFSSYKTIGIFHDIAFMKYPDLYKYAGSMKRLQKNSDNLAKEVWKAIAVSENTKEDIIRFYQIPSDKIIVAYPGSTYRIKGKTYARHKPYFLFVGALKKSKNIPFLIKAFSVFLQQSKESYDLLIAGGDKWLDPEISDTLNYLSLQQRASIHLLGYVDEQKLFSLYKGAVAFVSPGLYEGFGLTLVEAMSQGCVPIAGDTGSQKEVIGDCGILINPYNEKSLVQALIKVTCDPVYRRGLSLKAKRRSELFSWDTMAKIVYNSFYED